MTPIDPGRTIIAQATHSSVVFGYRAANSRIAFEKMDDTPDNEPSWQPSDRLKSLLASIQNFEPVQLASLEKMLRADQGKLFGIDLLACAVIKRSLSLCSAFVLLIEKCNYGTAASILRLQLDSCLRFYAPFIVERPHELAEFVLNGGEIRKRKDRNGQLMNDKYLVRQLLERFEWMERVYENASGFIHLSDKHIFSTFNPSEGSGGVNISVSPTDDRIPQEFWIEMTTAFCAATEALQRMINGWIWTKENPEQVAKLRGRTDPWYDIPLS